MYPNFRMHLLSILCTFRPSITRISGDAKDHKKELWNSQDSLKAVTLPETIQERPIPESPTIIHPKNEKGNHMVYTWVTYHNLILGGIIHKWKVCSIIKG